MNSWKTTLFGFMAAIGAGIIGAYATDPKLFSSFPAWFPGLGALLSTIGPGGIGLAARDNNKTSEQVNAGKPSNGLPLGMFLVGMVALALFLFACSSTPKRIAYNVVKAPAVTAQEALKAWDSYVGQQKAIGKPVPTSQLLTVRDAYQKYQRAEFLAIDAARIAGELAPGTSSASLAAKLQAETTRQAMADALADFFQLVQTFGVKL